MNNLEQLSNVVNCEHKWNMRTYLCNNCGVTQELWEEVNVRGNIELIRKIIT